MPDPWEIYWRDYYEDLGVSQDADTATINAAFRARARDAHPDRYVGAEEPVRAEAERRFRLLSEAYEVLRDRDQRERYDAARANALALRNLRVEGPRAVWSWSRGFVVESTLSYEGGTGSGVRDLSVYCDDPDVELEHVRLRRTRTGDIRIVVLGRLIAGGSRNVVLQYRTESHVVVQALRVRAPLAPLLRLVMPAGLHPFHVFLLALFGFFGTGVLVMDVGNDALRATLMFAGAVATVTMAPRVFRRVRVRWKLRGRWWRVAITAAVILSIEALRSLASR